MVLDIDVSAEYDGTVTHWIEGDVADPERNEIFTIILYSVPRLHIEDVTVANVVQIFYERRPEGYLNTVSEEKHGIYESELAVPQQRQQFEHDEPRQSDSVVGEVVAGIYYLKLTRCF